MNNELEPERDDQVINYALGWSLIVIGSLVVVAGGGYLAYNYMKKKEPPPVTEKIIPPPKKRVTSNIPLPDLKLTDITKTAGIDFVHTNGAAGERLLPETMGSGCAFFDYDRDGDQDLLFVSSNRWPWSKAAGPDPTCRLYQNNGKGKFADVTKQAGLDQPIYGMGVACADYDGDGWTDLFITAVGFNRLYKNNEGVFEDVTEGAGVAGGETEWSTSAAFFDYDGDRDLDLFVGNYVRWSREIDLDQSFSLTGVGRAYGPPTAFDGTFPYLYRNEGDGKFRDVSKEAGIQVKNLQNDVPMAKTMGIAPVDINRDGWLDVILANDTVQNLLFVNQKNGTFREEGVTMGIAFDNNGTARGAMGIDYSWFRNNDQLAVVIGNFASEMTALYVSASADGVFTDYATSTGFGPPTRLEVKFGTLFLDADLDSRPDVFASNGHLESEINQVMRSQHYAQMSHFIWNAGPGKTEFVPMTDAECGPDYFQPMVGRGSAYADIDGDGDLDLAVVGNNTPARLYRNDQALGNNWIRFKLEGKSPNRDAIGARLELIIGDKVMRSIVMPARGYCSHSESILTFGLGKEKKIDRVVIHWPGGMKQELSEVPALNQLHRLEEPGGE